MKYLLIIFLVIPVLSFGQQDEMSVYLSSDEVQLEGVFSVRFEINNSSATFEPPAFNNILVVAGPHVSSNFSIINGVASQSLSYEYKLQTRHVGQFFIGSASFTIDDKIIESPPIEINVFDVLDRVNSEQPKMKKVYSSLKEIQLSPSEQKELKTKKKLKKYRKKY